MAVIWLAPLAGRSVAAPGLPLGPRDLRLGRRLWVSPIRRAAGARNVTCVCADGYGGAADGTGGRRHATRDAGRCAQGAVAGRRTPAPHREPLPPVPAEF